MGGTFGYTPSGTGTVTIENVLRGNSHTFTGATGSLATKITVSLSVSVDRTYNVKCAIYLVSDNSKVAETESRNLSLTTTLTEYDFTFVSPPSLTNGVAYYLMVCSAAENRVCYVNQIATTGGTSVSDSITFPTFPDPLVPTSGTLRLGMYCTYSGAFSETRTETATNTDTFSRVWTATNTNTETVDNDDTISRVLTKLYELVLEGVVNTDTLTSSRVLSRIMDSEAVLNSDSLLRLINRISVDTVSNSDQWIRNLERSLTAETVGETDTVVKYPNRLLNDVVVNSDDIELLRTIAALLVESVANTDGLTKQMDKAAILETVLNSDTKTIMMTVRDLLDTIENDDVISRVHDVVREFNESIGEEDAYESIKGAILTISESIQNDDTALTQLVALRLFVEEVLHVDILDAEKSSGLVLIEAILNSDAFLGESGKILSEIIENLEVILKEGDIERTLEQTSHFDNATKFINKMCVERRGT